MVFKLNKKSQGRKCLLCGKNNKSRLYLCTICQTNKFNVDALRTKLVIQGHINEFSDTYSKTYSIGKVNKNTKSFWDFKFKKSETLTDQDGMTKDKVNYIVRQLPKTKSTILDLGIGQGYLEQNLQRLKVEHLISGIDISERSIFLAQNKLRGEFIVGDILHVDTYFPNHKYDVIVAIEVIEHIFPHEIRGFYKKVKNLLRRNGKFIISTPLNENLTGHSENPSEHVRQYTIPILEQEFKDAGFKILKKKTFYAFRKLYFLKKVLANILLNKWEPNNIVIVAKKN